MLGFTAASTRVVTERSYSRYSRSTSDDNDTTAPGCTSASTSRISRSWDGFAYECSRQTPMVEMSLSRKYAATAVAPVRSNGRICEPSTARRPPTPLTRCAGTRRGGLTQKYELPYPSGTDCRAISRMCSYPSVVISPRLSILPSRSRLVATVVPCETADRAEPVTPSRVRTLSSAARKPRAGSPGVDGLFVVTSSPVSSSTATASVKVPPVSIPTLIAGVTCRPRSRGILAR